MKTKTSSRSGKKTPTPPARARAAKPASTRRPVPPKAAATKKGAAKPAKGSALAAQDKYRQSGAPWWKQFL